MQAQVQDETQLASSEGSEDGEKGQEGFTLALTLKTLIDDLLNLYLNSAFPYE